MGLKIDGGNRDIQSEEIQALAPEGQRYFPATRTYSGEWPKMATKEAGQGKGKPKKKVSKACANQQEWDQFMADATIEPEQQDIEG